MMVTHCLAAQKEFHLPTAPKRLASSSQQGQQANPADEVTSSAGAWGVSPAGLVAGLMPTPLA